MDDLSTTGLFTVCDVLDEQHVYMLRKVTRMDGDWNSLVGIDTERQSYCVKSNKVLLYSLSKVVRAVNDQLKHHLTHVNMCECINMICWPGEMGQDLHSDHYAPHDAMRWYTLGICLTDIDESNGTFDYISGSHQIYNNTTHDDIQSYYHEITSYRAEQLLESLGRDNSVAKLSLRAGDVFCYDSSLVHRGTPNTSTDRFRDILFVTFGPSFKEWYEYAHVHMPQIAHAIRYNCVMNGDNKKDASLNDIDYDVLLNNDHQPT